MRFLRCFYKIAIVITHFIVNAPSHAWSYYEQDTFQQAKRGPCTQQDQTAFVSARLGDPIRIRIFETITNSKNEKRCQRKTFDLEEIAELAEPGQTQTYQQYRDRQKTVSNLKSHFDLALKRQGCLRNTSIEPSSSFFTKPIPAVSTAVNTIGVQNMNHAVTVRSGICSAAERLHVRLYGETSSGPSPLSREAYFKQKISNSCSDKEFREMIQQDRGWDPLSMRQHSTCRQEISLNLDSFKEIQTRVVKWISDEDFLIDFTQTLNDAAKKFVKTNHPILEDVFKQTQTEYENWIRLRAERDPVNPTDKIINPRDKTQVHSALLDPKYAAFHDLLKSRRQMLDASGEILENLNQPITDIRSAKDRIRYLLKHSPMVISEGFNRLQADSKNNALWSQRLQKLAISLCGAYQSVQSEKTVVDQASELFDALATLGDATSLATIGLQPEVSVGAGVAAYGARTISRLTTGVYYDQLYLQKAALAAALGDEGSEQYLKLYNENHNLTNEAIESAALEGILILGVPATLKGFKGLSQSENTLVEAAKAERALGTRTREPMRATLQSSSPVVTKEAQMERLIARSQKIKVPEQWIGRIQSAYGHHLNTIQTSIEILSTRTEAVMQSIRSKIYEWEIVGKSKQWIEKKLKRLNQDFKGCVK